MGKIRKLVKLAVKGINLIVIASFLLITTQPTLIGLAQDREITNNNTINSNIRIQEKKSIDSSDLLFKNVILTNKPNLNISSLHNTTIIPTYYYGTSVSEIGFVGSPCSGFQNCNGTVEWSFSSNVIGPQDNFDSEVINSSNYENGIGLRACMVVSLGQIIYLDNGIVQAYVHQSQNITQDMGIKLYVSNEELACESPDWIVAANYSEVGSNQIGTWYGGTYSGEVETIKIEIWSDGGNIFCLPRDFYIDSVRVFGISIPLLDRSSLSNNGNVKKIV